MLRPIPRTIELIAVCRCSWVVLLATVLVIGLTTSPVLADPIDDYNVAAQFYKERQWDHAEEAFRRFIVQYPTHERVAAARLYEGQALVHLRKFALARDLFRTFVEKHQEHPDLYLAMYRVGECSYFLEENQAARGELDRFISTFPQHELTEWALQYLAETQLRLNDPRGALASTKLQLERFPQGRLADDARYLEGKAEQSLGNKPAALAAFEKLAASETNPRAADALIDVGMLQYDARQFEAARNAFAFVRQRFPQSPLVPIADLNAGYASYHLQQFDDAMTHFQRAAQVPNQAADANFWIGMSQKSKQAYPAAAQTFKSLAESATDEVVALKARFHWADSELRGGEYAASQAQFLVVVDKAPQGPLAADALHLATEAALLNGNLDEANRLHQRFEREYKSNGLWLLQRLLHGRVALARGDRAFDAEDPATARQDYQTAAQEFTEVVQESKVSRTSDLARLLLARSYDRLEQPEQVLSTLEPLVVGLRNPDSDGEFAEALTLSARAALKLNRNQEAVDVAQLFVSRFETHEQLRDALASLALAESRLQHDAQVDTALQRLWLAEADRPLAQRTTYQLADQAYNAKDWSRASQLFQMLIDGGSGEFQTASLSGLGYSQYELQQYAEAAQTFDKLVATGIAGRPLAADAAHMRALAYRQAGDVAAAVEAYQSALRQFSRIADAKNLSAEDQQVVSVAFQCAKGLARLQAEQKQLAAANDAYSTAVDQLLLLPDAQQQEVDKLIHEWALLHYNANDYARSDELFQRLVALRPTSDLADDAKLYLGESQFFGKKYETAKPAFTALSKDPQADDFVRQRALVLLLDIAWEEKDWATVATIARELIDAFPQGDQVPFAQYRLGEALLQTGDAAAALEVLQPLHATTDPSVRQADWFSGVRLLLAEAQLQSKDYPAVETTVEMFRAEQPESPLLYQADEILGRRHINEAQWDKAREALRRVVDSASGRRTETAAKAQLLIAETYLREMKDSEAVAEYYKVFLNYSFPDYQAPALYQAGQCDERLERWKDAAKSYETLIEKFPGHEYATKAKAALDIVRKRIPAESLTPEPVPSN
ncbi:MAG: tetratricopeptide repeat protein [Planctomycetaceae bacterium]